MATIFFSTQKNLYAISTFSLLTLFLLSLLYFSKQSLQPNLSLYRDHYFSSLSSLNTRSQDNLNIPILLSQDLSRNSNGSFYNSTISKGLVDNSRNSNGSVENSRNSKGLVDSSRISNGSVEKSRNSSGLIDDINVLVQEDRKKLVLEKNLNVSANDVKESVKWKISCDLYVGSWVKDEENYPIYKAGSCPFVDEAYDCQSNGRKDSQYMNWRWKPDGCDIPRFNATDFLTRLRGKRLMLVGDSMNRNQFESLLCMLYEGLSNKSKMYEIHGYKITKGRGYYIFKFEDYNCTVEFVRSHFLVREGTRVNGQGNNNPTLSIDRIDKSANRWKRVDILIFNTGHWWTHGKTSRGKNYYKEGDYVYPKFDAVEAFKKSMSTWAKWIDKNVDAGKSVFYRGYSSAHFRGGDWDSGGSCNGETELIKSGAILDDYPVKMKIVQDVIREMQFPVVLLNITKLTNFRKDGHPSVYGKNRTLDEGKKISTRRQDCSHWCLPGVPDAWNELIYANLVLQTR
ncbi:Trichome birefringence [Heracleum sosnowskyi]|uniref:Trichome birefringence n=1 Tax=Heracleum sosnowskyi TaxID=360622 RepID=A0AAD8MBI5_9APIA|nr:Trichome birefringence [Heracleum sosnowskyi]